MVWLVEDVTPSEDGVLRGAIMADVGTMPGADVERLALALAGRVVGLEHPCERVEQYVRQNWEHPSKQR